MAIKITVNLAEPADDLLEGYGAGAKIHIQRDTVAAFTAPVDLPLVSIVSGTEQYEVWDTAGTTTSWYRWRVENTTATVVGEWSAAFQPYALTTYATITDLAETMNLPNEAKYNLLADLLIDASDAITHLCGRDFYRHPQLSGTETRTYHIKASGQSSLKLAVNQPIDIVSVTTLEIGYAGGTYTTVAAGSTGYYLEPAVPAPGWPYTSIILSRYGTYDAFPVGDQVVRITGVFGWPAVPSLIKRATVDLAREWYRVGPGGGGPIGMSALGQPIFQRGMPPTVQKAQQLFSSLAYLYP